MTSRTVADNITFAFQPIIDVEAGGAFALEALVRGASGETAHSVLSSVSAGGELAFDAACRRRAVELAAFLGVRAKLSVNVSALAICDYRYGLHATLDVARKVGWPAERLIFEMTEHSQVPDAAKLLRWITAARNRGATVALDDFGAGYANVDGLLRLRPDMVKLDMQMVRSIDIDPVRQAIVRGLVEACAQFDCDIVAEGIETQDELDTLRTFGIRYMQGYFLAPPLLATSPAIARKTYATAVHGGS
jgi:EAL domain-containing protein (putative c-di-GMP-specific phosphodiesterase class I)